MDPVDGRVKLGKAEKGEAMEKERGDAGCCRARFVSCSLALSLAPSLLSFLSLYLSLSLAFSLSVSPSLRLVEADQMRAPPSHHRTHLVKYDVAYVNDICCDMCKYVMIHVVIYVDM